MHTVVDLIAKNAGDGTLTVLGAGNATSTTLSWAAVHERARRMGTVLAAAGIRPGHRVGLLGNTSTELVTALQAVWLTGAAVTVLPVPPQNGGPGRTDNLVSIIRDASLHFVLLDQRFHNGAAAWAGIARLMSLSELASAADDALPATPHPLHPKDLALLQYTSGSTRNPRGVPVTHGHLAANIAAIKTALGHPATHPSRTVSWLPLYHDMGLIGFLVLQMSCGCSLILQSPAAFVQRPAVWLDAMSRYRATMSGAPNFAYPLMTRMLAAGREYDLGSMRCLLSGGEPVDAAAMAEFAAAAGRCGLDPAALVPAYGLAEATLAVTIAPVGDGVRVDSVDPHALETAGRAIPLGAGRRARNLVKLGGPLAGTTLRITDPETGERAGPRTVGHIEVRGPSVVGHYWPEPPPGSGGWLRTGDLGYLVDTGSGDELVVCGRAKDMLIACGRNIFPQDVEAAAAVPGVRPGGAVAFGMAGDQLVVAVESRVTDPAELRRRIMSTVTDVVGLRPAAVLVLPFGALPKTSSGKLRRAETRRLYMARRLLSTPAGRTSP